VQYFFTIGKYADVKGYTSSYLIGAVVLLSGFRVFGVNMLIEKVKVSQYLNIILV